MPTGMMAVLCCAGDGDSKLPLAWCAVRVGGRVELSRRVLCQQPWSLQVCEAATEIMIRKAKPKRRAQLDGRERMSLVLLLLLSLPDSQPRATIRRHRKRAGSHPGQFCCKTVAGSGRQGKPVASTLHPNPSILNLVLHRRAPRSVYQTGCPLIMDDFLTYTPSANQRRKERIPA